MKKEIILLISTIFCVNVITAQDVEKPGLWV